MFKTVLIVLVLALKLTDIISAYRLAHDVKPQHYSIKLQPYMEENTFEGEATITLYINYEQENIILHSVLNITEVSINQLPGFVVEEEDEKISVWFQDSGVFQPGEHVLYFKYNGTLQQRFGLLKASYQYINQTGFLVVNEFEPNHARKAFPCFDEPVFKANFNIRLVTPNDSYIAVSNMPEIARYSTSNGMIYSFATSVKMSTYLLSLAITDYPYYEETLEHNNIKIPVRVYTYNASKENNNHAIEGAKSAIRFYSDYTGMDYPLPKLDMIEYNKGKIAATETWGLIQFKEGLLTKNLKLYDPWQCYLVIFHELAHFWFGNLVTNDWWNDLWLHEGFATFMSFKLMEKEDKTTVRPSQINMMELLEIEEEFGTLQLVNYLNSTEFVERRFDKVVYSKGAFLLASLEAVVGKQTFQDVLKIFLKTFAYGTATTNNLISIFESHILNINIRSFLESYIYQTGFPIVNVDESGGSLVLTQIPLYGESNKWTIPVSYTCENNTANLVWLDRDADSVTVKCEGQPKWILFGSVKLPGIYAVNYTDKLWTDIIDHLDDLPKTELENIAENAGVLYLSKNINCNIVLQLLDRMDNDSLDIVFKAIMSVAKDMACFEEEFKILVEYLNQKFETIDGLLRHFNVTCEQGNKIVDEADYNVRQCAHWISNNLANFIKP